MDAVQEPALADPQAIFDNVFEKAKARDEFEYVCALLRIRGLEGPGWDPLRETQQLLADMMGLIEAPLRDDTRIRLGLLVYCHLTEADAVYEVLDNMVSIIEDNRTSIAPFRDLYRERPNRPPVPPSAAVVVRYVREHANRVGENPLAELFGWMFHDEVRNAFFHSDYTIHDGEFRSRDGRFDVDNVRRQSMPLRLLVDYINRGLQFFQMFMNVFNAHRLSYTESKVVLGRMGQNGEMIPITLLVDPTRGVYGITTDVQEPLPAQLADG